MVGRLVGRDLLIGFNGGFGLLGGGTEAKETATKGHGADHEPGPSERQTAEDISQPVDSEKHPAGSDTDSQGRGDRRQRRPSRGERPMPTSRARAAKLAADAARVTGRKGRTAEAGQPINIRSSAIDNPLDQVNDPKLPSDRQEKKRRHGKQPVAPDHGEAHETRKRPEDSCAAQLRKVA